MTEEREKDEAWLLAAERGDPVLPHPRAAEYERLKQQIATLPTLEAPAGWQQRVLAELDAPPPRAWWHRALVVGVPAFALAAGILVWLVVRDVKPEPRTSEVAMEVRRQGDARRNEGNAALGDVLVVRGVAGKALWLYRDQALVVSCPGPSCEVNGDVLRTELTLSVPGTYRALLVDDATVTPRGLLADDLAALERAGIRAVTAPPLEVR
jgi:hypothetical protein